MAVHVDRLSGSCDIAVEVGAPPGTPGYEDGGRVPMMYDNNTSYGAGDDALLLTAPRDGTYTIKVGNKAYLDPFIDDTGVGCPYRLAVAKKGILRTPLPSL